MFINKVVQNCGVKTKQTHLLVYLSMLETQKQKKSTETI